MRQVNHARMVGAMKIKLHTVSQVKMAKALGVSTTTMSRWVRGDRPVPHRHIAKLARILDKPVAWLCKEETK